MEGYITSTNLDATKMAEEDGESNATFMTTLVT